MPEVCVGQTVLYFDSQGSAPTPAIVARLGDSTINVRYFTDRHVVERTGVRHVSSPPPAAGRPTNVTGYWDHTDFTKKVLALMADLSPAPAKAAQANPTTK